MALIDTHLHLIYRDRIGYSWTAGIPALATGDFTLQDVEALTGDRVSGAIFMEAGADDADYQTEARFIHTLMQPGSRLLGQIAACRPDQDAGFSDWIDECEGLGVVGYRRLLHVVDDSVSQTEVFRRNLRAIGAKGRVYDIVVRADQLGLAADLVRDCPDQPYVLDHCGVPDIAGGGLESWKAGITALAEHQEVTCKLSGIMAYCAPGTASLATIRPYVDHVLAVFGPDRMVWGSDWPVVNLSGDLPGWLDVTDAILAELSADEAAAVSFGNAKRVYGV